MIKAPEKHTIKDELEALKIVLYELKRVGSTNGWIYKAVLCKINQLEKDKYNKGAIK